MTESGTATPILATRRGRSLLLLLLGVAFLDFVDASIVNVALPSIRADLGFSVVHLQWVLSGYLLTYGGFILLGGRLADLLGRRRLVVTGTVVFLVSSVSSGLSQNPGSLIGSRLAQGVGAALMVPAALSILTTTFNHPVDRAKALGAWGALAGLGSAAGVLLGGVLSDYLGWRWVFFVNPPICVAVLVAIFRLLPQDPRRHRAPVDVIGAFLVTGAMLLLVYTIVETPDKGWGATSTVAGLIGAGVLLAIFALVEANLEHPLFPFSIFRIKGLGEADLTQTVAMAGFYSMFLFATLYMQNVLHYSQIRTGVIYLPVTLGVAVGAGVATKLVPRTGTRPLIVAGALVGAGGIFWLSHIPVHGHYWTDLAGPLQILSFGLGALFVGVTTAAQAGVPEEQAGLAAAMINASAWLGGALGVAVFTAIATSTTKHRLAHGVAPASGLTSGFRAAFLASAVAILVAAVIAFRSRNATSADVAAGSVEPGGGDLVAEVTVA